MKIAEIEPRFDPRRGRIIDLGPNGRRPRGIVAERHLAPQSALVAMKREVGARPPHDAQRAIVEKKPGAADRQLGQGTDGRPRIGRTRKIA